MKARSLTIAVLTLSIVVAGSQQSSPPPNQLKEYQADVSKTIIELQQFRESRSIQIERKGKPATATLVNLNPAINAWFLLKLTPKEGGPERNYHLENGNPGARRILLDPAYPSGIVVVEGKDRFSCDLFASDALERAKSSALVYSPLCDGRIYLRNAVTGHRTNVEAGAEFLREHVWGAEKIIALGHILLGEANRETGTAGTGAAPHENSADAPLAAAIDPKYSDRTLLSANLGIALDRPVRAGLIAGAWYPASGNPGVYASIVEPNLIDAAILQSYRASVNALDRVEASALCYLVAFDLNHFQLGFTVGTNHPGVGWSHQVHTRNPALPGPDGIESVSPLIATGLIGPQDAPKTVATFAGGYKRWHGAFKYGDFAARNHGSHYGFIEKGVVFSKLQPGLATVFALTNGSVGMKTWSEADNASLEKVKYARQNGVALIEFNETSPGKPGALVNRWGPGNWSGSEDAHLRTMRAGLALQRNGRKRFLIYAVFSDATPSAMARVFQAYRCDYAMLLDMNALEFTYLALYRRHGAQIFVDHILKGMGYLEKKSGHGEIVPRFLGYADNRDFFYVMRR
jgi:hypothetical protein